MKGKVIIITIVIIILIIFIPSVVAVSQNHKENLISVTEKRITEAATLCIKEGNCNSNLVYLSNLYQYNYLEKEYNPITKEYYSETSYVTYEDDGLKFISVY